MDRTSFATLAALAVTAFGAATAGAAPPAATLDLASGLGCGAQCVKSATVAAKKTSASVKVTTDTPATITVQAGTTAPLPTSQGPLFTSPAASATSPAGKTAFTAQLKGLEPDTTYHIVVRARDAEGRTAVRQGTFRTKALDRHVTVTFHSIMIFDDADNGAYGAGEMQFWLHAGDGWAFSGDSWDDYFSVKSGKTITLKTGSRTGITVSRTNPPDQLPLRTLGVECDEALWSNCVYEGGTFPETGGGSISNPKFEYANAGMVLDLDECVEPKALPPNYGTGLPEGGDCYFSFETSAHHLKYRVLGWVNVDLS
jgi:hypothetical protein